jgi:hypothetical protein
MPNMPLRIKDTTIVSIEETETKKMKILRMASKAEEMNLSLEVPEALSEPFHVKDNVIVTIDSEEISRGEKTKLYLEGTIFRINETSGLSVVAGFGGLRLVLDMASPKPTQSKIFSSGKTIFLTLE